MMVPALVVAAPVRPSISLLLLSLIFCLGGVMHFVSPAFYLRMMPTWIPSPLAMVYLSGAAEVLGGIGILLPATRVAAGWGLIALLVAVFPANLHLLQSALAAHASRVTIGLLVLRLPLQPLLVYWVWRAAVRGLP